MLSKQLDSKPAPTKHVDVIPDKSLMQRVGESGYSLNRGLSENYVVVHGYEREHRIKEMAGLRGLGYTLQEIGDMFKISRERVRQLLQKAQVGSSNELLHVSQVADILQCSRRDVLEFVRAGVLKSVRQDGVRLLFRQTDLPSIVRPARACPMCGAFIPRNRKVYCSSKCYDERWKNYRNWPEERKTKHRALLGKWRKEHPEQVRLISARSAKKYRLKVQKTRRFENMVQDLLSRLNQH